MTSARNSTVFRVTGLPTTQPDNVLDTLNAAIKSNLLEEERSGIIQVMTVVLPSCYDENQEYERVALVEFRGGVPKFLSELTVNPLGDWQVEMDDTDISFDRHFFGFTQLYAPQTGVPISADIIAITGLDGHAYGSWRGKGNLGRMWLRDFLSKDLPRCRTMIYGYNSKLSSHGVDTIMDYGRDLIEEMKKIRSTKDSRQRPLFFIAHSFGGIILAHCLIKAVQTNEDDHPTIASLHRATYGILFFATPHKGLLISDMQKMLAGEEKHPRNALLEQISLKSDLLISQLADFKNLIRDRKIVSFYETEQTRQLVLDSENRQWQRTGEFVTAVDTDSALLQLPDYMEHKIPLPADHSMIVKFDSKSASGYRSALDRLRRFEKDAPREVAARFSTLIPSPAQDRLKPSSTVPFPKDDMFVGREDIIANIHKRHEQAASQNNVHSRVALVGLGGVGKSQIAIEYSYQIREQFPQTWIFWVHASNRARFEESYRMIADRIKLPQRHEPAADILQLVRNWLCDEENGRWMMILDNADDSNLFFDRFNAELKSDIGGLVGESIPLSTFLPQTPNGSILVTSRSGDAACRLTGSHRDIIKVEPMDES
ncbi:hypothetical protein MMC29_007297, partial [Sticta canariensis]|nr:hypothetical protein [Sticta canariensis]